MAVWVLGVAFLAAAAPSLSRGYAPDPSSVARGGPYAPLRSLAGAQAGAPSECPSGKPVKVVPSVVPALGQSPLWAATNGKPLAWEGPGQPARVLWLRDVAVKGAAMLSGKARTGSAKATFAANMYGNRELRFKLDALGDKPKGVKEADLLKVSFHWTFVWFPEPGCYEMAARVGSQQSLIYLDVVSPGKKTT